MEMGILDQQKSTENASKERALICVISCNGQSSLEVPCFFTSPGQLYHWHWVFTGGQGADFPSDPGTPSRSLCQNVVFLSKWKFVGNNSLAIKEISFSLSCQHNMLPLHEATGPRLGQGCRTTRQAEPEICCLFLWWPAGNSKPPVQELPACPPVQASGSASSLPAEHSAGACSWVGRAAAQRVAEANQCNSALPMASPRKMACSYHTCIGCIPLRTLHAPLLRSEGESLESAYHDTPLQSLLVFHGSYTSLAQLRQECPPPHLRLKPLAGLQYLPCNSPRWRIAAVKLTGLNGTARPGKERQSCG